MVEIVGKIFKSNNYGRFKVIKESGRNKHGQRLYLIKFLDTGFETVSRKSVIIDGRVKDRFFKSVANVGYVGKSSVKNNYYIYKIWNQMLNKCYNKNNNKYSVYGAKGVTVCERWHNFSNFLEDLPKIEGYDEKLFNKRGLELDKDLKQQDKELKDRVYSLKTCIFLKPEKHSGIKKVNQKYFKAISPTGKIYFGYNQAKFAREHNLLHSQISACINKKRKTHHNWRFFEIEEVKNDNNHR